MKTIVSLIPAESHQANLPRVTGLGRICCWTRILAAALPAAYQNLKYKITREPAVRWRNGITLFRMPSHITSLWGGNAIA
jgi:hypothetical protein